MSLQWIFAVMIISTSVTMAWSQVLRTQRPQSDDATLPEAKEMFNEGLDIPTPQNGNQHPIPDLQPRLIRQLLRFHQFPYIYPYLHFTNNALSAVQEWKRPSTTTSSTTVPTTTTDWDDWDD